jgi:hypothetical protein
MRESELSFGSLLSGKKVKMFGRFPCAARAFFFMSKNANKQTSKQTNKQTNKTTQQSLTPMFMMYARVIH